MDNSMEIHPTTPLHTWLQAVRAFSFTASIIPVVVAGVLALSSNGPVRWELGVLAAVGAVLFHAGTNLVSDAEDFSRGVDREGTHGGSGVLVAGLLPASQVFWAGVGLFVLGILVGLVLVWARGLTILWLGLAGLLGGFFYGGKPFGYKYIALGDLMVFVLMGPLLVIGAYFALTGDLHINVLYVSIPVGCLVAAILSSNNLRDIANDSHANIKTLANVMGPTASAIEYYLLVGAAYVVVVIMVVASVASPWCLLALLSLPLAIKNVMAIRRAGARETSDLADIDVRTAKLHFLFGVLLSLGLALAEWV